MYITACRLTCNGVVNTISSVMSCFYSNAVEFLVQK
jgi:hypothetical protein